MNLRSTQIRELPNSIGELESLRRLDLKATKITELPASIGYLKKLQHLHMYGSKLRELPKAIEMLENLEMLTYPGCRNTDITWPPKLSQLYIHDDDPRSLTWPPQLSRLSISCDDPQSVQSLPLGLRYLKLEGVKSPIKQLLLSELRYLPELVLSKWGLREIEFEQLENLHCLRVWECESLVRLLGLSRPIFKEANYVGVTLGNIEEHKAFFDTLYKFVYLHGTYLKPR
ncbi:hypothetical protein NL676_034339, partial [Syzygium grande]